MSTERAFYLPLTYDEFPDVYTKVYTRSSRARRSPPRLPSLSNGHTTRAHSVPVQPSPLSNPRSRAPSQLHVPAAIFIYSLSVYGTQKEKEWPVAKINDDERVAGRIETDCSIHVDDVAFILVFFVVFCFFFAFVVRNTLAKLRIKLISDCGLSNIFPACCRLIARVSISFIHVFPCQSSIAQCFIQCLMLLRVKSLLLQSVFRVQHALEVGFTRNAKSNPQSECK